MGLRILITNWRLDGYSGTETFVRDLALGLAADEHEAIVYSPRPGPIAQEIAAAGIQVVADLSAVRKPPDIIHGHHHVETTEALLRFPEAPGVFVLHDRSAWHDVPPVASQIRRYVAVDLNCRERL